MQLCQDPSPAAWTRIAYASIRDTLSVLNYKNKIGGWGWTWTNNAITTEDLQSPGVTNFPTHPNLVHDTRIELVFPPWKGSVLTDRRIVHAIWKHTDQSGYLCRASLYRAINHANSVFIYNLLYENTLRILYQTETIQHGLCRWSVFTYNLLYENTLGRFLTRITNLCQALITGLVVPSPSWSLV